MPTLLVRRGQKPVLAGRRWLLATVLGGLLGLGPVGAQTVPATPAAPATVPATTTAVPDDTTRQAVVAATPRPAEEPTATVSRRSAWRIGGVIALIILTTLLLYNVRSR